MSKPMRCVVTHDWMPVVAKQAFQLHHEPDHSTAFSLKSDTRGILTIKQAVKLHGAHGMPSDE